MVKVLAIDQSISGSAVCGMENGKQYLLGTIKHPSDMQGFDRARWIRAGVRDLLKIHEPNIFVMEDYALGGGRNINSSIPLIELGGLIKDVAVELGYSFGRDALFTGQKVMRIQTNQQMKKFCLGNGSTKKDSGYLLNVFNRMKLQFEDDNQADAYMHAWTAGIVVQVLRGVVPIGNLPSHQQEVLIASGIKKKSGLSMAKAMKLSDAQKLELVGW